MWYLYTGMILTGIWFAFSRIKLSQKNWFAHELLFVFFTLCWFPVLVYSLVQALFVIMGEIKNDNGKNIH